MIVLWVLFGIIGVIVLVTLLILFAPINYRVQAKIGDETSALIYVSYCFRLVYYAYEYYGSDSKSTLRIFGFKKNIELSGNKTEKIKKAKKANTKKKKKPKQKSKPKTEKDSGGAFDFVRSVLTYPHRKTIMSIIVQALKKFGRAVCPKILDISGKVGLADPANTGFFLVAYEFFANIMRVRQNVRLTGEFNSDELTLEADVFVKGRVSVWRLSRPFLWAVLQKPMRRLIWSALKG